MTASALRFGAHQHDGPFRGRQCALDERDDGRDATAAGERHDRHVGRSQHEEPRRAHHVDGVARPSALFIQFDIRPPGTRLTAVVKRSPISGELDIE